MAERFTDKELDDLDAKFFRILEDRTDAYAEHINYLTAENQRLQNRIDELEAEDKRLREAGLNFLAKRRIWNFQWEKLKSEFRAALEGE